MKFDHVAINVNDLFKSIDWYKHNLNAIVEEFNDSWAMLKIGDTRLALITKNTHPPHFALSVDSFNEFPDGVEIKTHHDGSYYLYKSDPDKNVIELIYWPITKREQ